MVGYCEREDVEHVLQEANLTGALGQDPEIVDDAITSQTDEIRGATKRHWYESGGTLLPSATVSATDMRYDVPSSPHRQDRQLFHHEQGVKYPKSTHGPYVRVPLGYADVTSLTALHVRDAGGDVTDWVADSDIVQGRGEDYYLSTPTDGGPAGRTALYVHEGSLPHVVDYSGMLVADFDYGTSPVPDTVRRMTAFLAAAELVVEDEFVTAISDNGQLVNVETKAQRWARQGEDLLDNYRATAVA